MNHDDTHGLPEDPRMSTHSGSSSASIEHNDDNMHHPIPVRPRLPNRHSSGTIIVSRDSSQVGPIDRQFESDDVRAMSPRRTSEDIENMGKAAREEMQRHALALQNSLIMIFNRIEAVEEEHDKLDNNNKFLQKYIGDLMSTSKITAGGSRGRK